MSWPESPPKAATIDRRVESELASVEIGRIFDNLDASQGVLEIPPEPVRFNGTAFQVDLEALDALTNQQRRRR